MAIPKFADRRIGLMVFLHLVLGLTMACAMAWPRFIWPVWASLPYMALGCSEVLLLGMWLGFSRAKWWHKLGGFVIGIVWLVFLMVAPESPRQWRFGQIDDLAGLPIGFVLAVAAVSLGCRFLVARVEHQDAWPLRPLGDELQFSMRSLIALTVVVALLLALRNVFRWVTGGRSIDEAVFAALGVVASLAWAMLLWACLGKGRVAVRLPLVLAGACAAGLIFPYYVGGDSWQFFIWSLLTVAIALYSSASLLAVRHCGYRLVSVWGSGREVAVQEGIKD